MSEWVRRRTDQTGGAARLALALLLGVAVVGIVGWVWQRSSNEAAERERIAGVLEVGPGTIVADIGAGQGEWTVDLARRVGPSGHVFSTEVNPELIEDIREAVADAELDNVTVIAGTASVTGLEGECCDAILLRTVYHHFTDPQAMNESMLRSLRPGGLIAVIDFLPRSTMSQPEGVPENRGGHGVPTDLLIQEMTEAGFEVVHQVDDWPGRNFCYLFRRPAIPERPRPEE